MTINETIDWFNAIFELNRKDAETKANFYCGITDDVERRKQEHHCKAGFLGITKCDKFETAKKVEELMHGQGYDTGNQLGNGNEKSIYVYMYKKVPDVTKE